MIIIPSTPRLSTPARSTTSSPDAASSSGVEAAITDRRMASSSMRGLSYGMDKAHAIDDQRVAGEHVEQQNALEDLGEVGRDLHRDLSGLAADEGQRQEQSGDQDADRIEPAEEGDDDGGEAVTRRDAGVEMADRPRHLDDAGEPGKRARAREGEQHQPIGAEAGKARRLRRGADEPYFESHDHAAEQDGRQHDDDERDHRAGMQAAGTLEQGRHG